MTTAIDASTVFPSAVTSLLAYANRYAPQQAPADYTIRFVPRDWTVSNNGQRR